MDTLPANGIVEVPSRHTVDQTIALIEAALAANGLQIFCTIDHSDAAHAVGLAMPATKVLLFGNPRSGTPVMLAAPTSAIEIPLKALVWADGGGPSSPCLQQSRVS